MTDSRHAACPRHLLALVAAVVVAGIHADALGQAADRVRLLDGRDLVGTIRGVSPDAIDLETSGGLERVGISDIREVFFEAEPAGLRTARGLLMKRDAVGALDEVAAIDPEELDRADDRILAEAEFVKAAAAGMRALAADADVDFATTAVAGFVARHPRSHHGYRMRELLGDLHARAGRVAEAVDAYATLQQGPPAVRVRASASAAAALHAAGRYADALRAYEAALGIEIPPGDRASGRLKQDAGLGRGRCLTGLGKPAEAIRAIRDAIDEVSPTETGLLATAFNALGAAQRAAGDMDRDAIVSYLTVDLVYNAAADEHAEALFNLVELWEKTRNPERARGARHALRTRYPDSPWTVRLPPDDDAS